MLKCPSVWTIGFFLCAMFVWAICSHAEDAKPLAPYEATARKILEKGLGERKAYALLNELIAAAPNRLSGSAGAADAVAWGRKTMEALGFEKVHLEPVTVPAWSRGKVMEAYILFSSGKKITLNAAALGGSRGTPPEGITAQVAEVHSFDELTALGDKAKGKIIFFNRPMDPTHLNPFQSYGEAGDERYEGAAKAGAAGGAAALVRSLTDRIDDFPHTGIMHYKDPDPLVPGIALSTRDAQLLSGLLKENPDVKVFLRTDCAVRPNAPSANVVGQITGSEKPDEIILLGAHLDAWDLGPGAQDDGGGCAQVLDALHLLKTLDFKPKRTIRVVLYMCEEFGGIGGRQYATAEARKVEKHLAAIESDAGVNLPLGLGVQSNIKAVDEFQKWLPAMQALGLFYIRNGYGGVDIGPLREQGTLLMSLSTNPQRYFEAHHSANDILASVSDREIEIGADALAAFAYILAEEGVPPPDPASAHQGHEEE